MHNAAKFPFVVNTPFTIQRLYRVPTGEGLPELVDRAEAVSTPPYFQPLDAPVAESLL